MRLGIVPKFIIPLTLLFATLTFGTSNYIKNIVAQEQLISAKRQALGIASQAAMMIDGSFDGNNLLRVVTLIALDENVTQAMILNRADSSVLASSYFQYAQHSNNDLPPLMTSALSQMEKDEHFYFTEIVDAQ